MIKKMILASAFVFALCSCNEKMSVSHQVEGQVTTVEFSVPVQQTKATAAFNEEVVNSLQVFVFGPDGKIDASGMVQGASLKLTCTTGEKEIFALVNATERKNVMTKQDLLAMTTDLNENNGAGLVMEGYARESLTANSTVTIPVFRNVARVALKSVKTAFELDVHKKQEFKITGVKLINVAGDKRITGNKAVGDVLDAYTVSPSVWYNKKGIVEAPLAMLVDKVSDVLVTSAVPYQTSHYFYCYPNPTTVDVSEGQGWTARFSRLVVTATLGGVTYHYPISIQNIKSNTCYDVSLTVTRPGSTSEDVPVQKLGADFKVEVRPWAKAPAVNEVI